ncbi:AraC family transcriptional regulator of adaptative response / methylphosphotriester-DNA alkyltransferase methyltransferase [Neobacillus niacini]|nr:AraC family transcriptional regulator of adaptative response / methylphosphotriester-DNA alkyltransferase methyltransferase [Neobacillus niacini]
MENRVGSEPLTEEKWQAILHNDANYNHQFFYAVKSTGIFCKPSCKSRPPKKENVLIFQNAEEAISAHFRPCKRCKPTGERLPDQEWIAQIIQYIEQNYIEKLTLETLAEACHGSPYHLHRTFKRITGVTPVEYIQLTRINKAKELLIKTNITIVDIALSVGMSNTPYFITLFKKKSGFTPAQYRQLNRKTEV